MRLLVCIGNTRTRVCSQTSKLVNVAAFPTSKKNYAQLTASVLKGSPRSIECIGIVSVVPWADLLWVRACKKEGLPFPLFLTAQEATRTAMAIRYSPIHSLGADRVCAALGAISRSPGRNRIVIDAGTAVTVDAITRDNTFQGGFIFPGPDLTMQALSTGTALLPRAEWKSDGPEIGRATQECMNQGVLNMFRGGVAQCIGALHEGLRIKDPVIFVTGGAAKSLHLPKKRHDIVLDPDLVFRGLEYWLNERASKRSC